MIELRFRAPGKKIPLGSLLARAVPGATGQDVARWCSDGRVRSGGQVVGDPRAGVPPGTLLELTLRAREIPSGGEEGSARVRREGPDWVVLERARAPARELCGLAPDASTGERVVAGAGTGGLCLVARDPGAAERLAGVLARGEGSLRHRAIAPAPPWRRGAFAPHGRGSGATQFHVVAEREGLAEIELTTGGAPPGDLRRELAALGAAALGDPLHGGLLVDGGLRLALVVLSLPSEGIELEAEARPFGWPEEPALAGSPGDPHGAPLLGVSSGTRAALARGHPWVLTDEETGDVGRFRPGALVRVEIRESASPLWLRVEPPGPVAARLWARGAGAGGAVGARVDRALARRAPLLEASAQTTTDAFRLIHGEADGFPALFVDRLGPLLRVLITGRACDLVREEAVEAVIARLGALLDPDPPVVEVIHLRERPRAELECVRLARGTLPEALRDPGAGGFLEVRERGLRFRVDPGLARPGTPTPGVGLFLDQRENRERLAGLARKGGRWLNLFAHTGAFSAALLAGGADEVLSVDADAAPLGWLEANLRENGLDARPHRSVRSDARRFLERQGARERFRGIVLDPPTSASGRRFWSVRRDLVALVAACLARLEPGGWLLACRNDRAGRGRLRATLEEAARAAGVELAALEPAPPGPDFPSLAGFPEGDPFEGVLARVAG